MRCYDFDKTIYKKDCSVSFFFYCLKRTPKMWFYSFMLAIYTFMHAFKLMKTKKFKEKYFKFLKWIDVDKMVEGFWEKETKHINKWYLDQMEDTDVVASASPEFLVGGAMQKINPKATLICTNMDKKTGKIEGNNIKGEHKKQAILEKFEEKFEACYSDSVSDLPMMDLGENRYLVVGEKVYEFGKQKPTFGQKIKFMLKLMRPHHYLKNGLILVPLFFSKDFTNWSLLLKCVYGFFAFSFLSSFVYIVNDIKDVEKDRAHSKKRKRPIASYMVGKGEAVVLAVLLFAVSMVLNYFIAGFNVWTYFVILCYAGINLAYSFKLKEVPIIDVFILALCYLIRIFYGGVVTAIPISKWLYLTVFCAALFMGLGKRRNEVRTESGSSRKVNRFYNYEFLDKNLYVCLALTLVFYSLWAIQFQPNTDWGLNGKLLLASIPIVYMILMKYSLIIEDKSHCGDPLDVLLKDWVLIALVLVYIAVMVVCLYIPLNIKI